VAPALLCPAYVSANTLIYNCQLPRHVQGFPLLGLLWADLTSKGSSLVWLVTRLPYHILMEHLWISQVLNTSLYTCHGLRTPLTRHNLTAHFHE